MKKVLKWTGIVVGILVVLAIIAVAGLSLSVSSRLNKTYQITPEAVAIPTDAASVAEGERLYVVYCSSCHGADAGGTEFFNDPALAYIPASNLTHGEGGVGEAYSDADWVRATRHGANPQGKPLLVMPAKDLNYLSDEDLGQIIAFLKQVPPVDRQWPAYSTTLMGRVLIALGAFGDVINVETIDHVKRPFTPAPGVTAEYGQYLVDTIGCRACHGPDLTGGKDPNPAAPPAPSLAPDGNLGSWDQQTFIAMIRVRKSEWMDFESLSHMTDDELSALWLYLSALP